MNTEPEPGVIGLEEDGKPEDRVEFALKCLPQYDAGLSWTGDSTPSFRYWKIRDYAYAYRSGLANPSMVSQSMQLLCFMIYFEKLGRKM